MANSKKRGLPLGYLTRNAFFGTLNALSVLEEERQDDGRFAGKAFRKAREEARDLWKFLKKWIWETEDAKLINSPDQDIITWKEGEGSIEFKFFELFFSIKVEERGYEKEKVVTIFLRKLSDNGSMELKSEIPMNISSLVSDGLPF
jgi:hypothetical protein